MPAATRAQRAVAVDAQLDDLAAQPREERRRCVEGDDPSCVHDRDAVAEPLGLVEVVRREQNRDRAAGSQASDHLEQLVADARVEPDGRLVEEEHLRLGNERPRDLEPTPLAAAVGRDGPVEQLGEAERLGELRHAGSRRGRFDTPQARVDVEVPPPGQGPVDDGVLEDDTACAARCERLGRHVEAGEAGASAGRDDGGREHPDRRRLAGAVRADEAEHLAVLDLEVDSPHRFDPARIGLLEPAHLDRGAGGHQLSHLNLLCGRRFGPRLVRHPA